MERTPRQNYTAQAERPVYTPGAAPELAQTAPSGDFAVSWDRLAGPHSRWLSLSRRFETAEEAYAWAEAQMEEGDDPFAWTVVRLSEFFQDCRGGTCHTCSR